MRRLLKLICSVTLISLLCGCMPSVSLGNRAIVQAIGVDSKEDGIVASVQCLNTSGENIVFKSEGKTLSEATTKSMLLQSKEIFYGSNQTIIISEDVAVKGLNLINDFFNSDYHSRGNVTTFISKSSAEDIIKTESKEGIISADLISTMAKNAEQNGLYPHINYIDVLKNLANSGYSYIPTVSKIKEDDSEKVVCDGVAIVGNNDFLGYLNHEQTEGLLFLLDKIKTRRIVFDLDDGTIFTADITMSNTDLEAEIKDGMPYFNFKIKASVTISSVSNRDFTNPLTDEIIKKAENALNKKIYNLCKSCIEKTVFEYGADIFGFSQYLKKYEYEFYKNHQDILNEVIKSSKIDIDVNSKMEKTGLSR